MLNSWLHIDPTSCGRRFSQFRWSRLTTKTRISGHSRRAIFYSNFVSFATKCFRFCPLRFRGRLLRLLRCLITRTIKLLTLERSIFFFKNYQKTSRSFLISSEAFVFIAAVYYRPKRKRQAATFSDVEQRCQYLLVCHKSKPGPFAKCDSVFNGQNRTRE